jgi:hypothetical protein
MLRNTPLSRGAGGVFISYKFTAVLSIQIKIHKSKIVNQIRASVAKS